MGYLVPNAPLLSRDIQVLEFVPIFPMDWLSTLGQCPETVSLLIVGRAAPLLPAAHQLLRVGRRGGDRRGRLRQGLPRLLPRPGKCISCTFSGNIFSLVSRNLTSHEMFAHTKCCNSSTGSGGQGREAGRRRAARHHQGARAARGKALLAAQAPGSGNRDFVTRMPSLIIASIIIITRSHVIIDY